MTWQCRGVAIDAINIIIISKMRSGEAWRWGSVEKNNALTLIIKRKTLFSAKRPSIEREMAEAQLVDMSLSRRDDREYLVCGGIYN